MAITTNADGLQMAYGANAARNNRAGFVSEIGPRNVLRFYIKATDLNTSTDTMIPLFQDTILGIGTLVTKGTLTVLEAFTSDGSATLDVGLLKLDNTALDSDGFDAAIALTAINAVGKQVDMDGALIKGVALVAAGVPSAKAGTAVFTAGLAEVLIEYIPTK